jgi:hypothetical protein
MTSSTVRWAALTLVLLLAAHTAQAQAADSPEPTFWTYTAEGTGSVACGLLAECAGAAAVWPLVYRGGDLGPSLNTAFTYALPVAAVGLAGGATLAGHALRQHGRFWPTLAWSAGSMAVGVGLAAFGLSVGSKEGNPLGPMAAVVVGVGVATPLVLPTVGYNLSRPKDALSSRFLPPQVGLASETRPDRTRVVSTRLELVRVRL